MFNHSETFVIHIGRTALFQKLIITLFNKGYHFPNRPPFTHRTEK